MWCSATCTSASSAASGSPGASGSGPPSAAASAAGSPAVSAGPSARASTWSSTRSTTRCASRRISAGSSPSGSGDDFDPEEVIGGDLTRALDGEHRLERGDRHRELLVVGRARRQLLELESGPHDPADPALLAVAARPLDDLERDPGDEGHAEDPREHEDPPGGQPDRREDEDRDDHDDEEEARPAAGMEAAEAVRALGGERLARLVGGDRLVLGAVVLEDPPQVGQARDERQVAEEDRRAQDALDEPEQDRGVERVLDEAREPDRGDEEEPDREPQRHDHRADPGPAPDLLGLAVPVAELRVGRVLERAEADLERLAQRDDPADDRQPQRGVALQPRDERPRPDGDLALGRADGDGPRRDATHHHALEDGLPAHGRVPARHQAAVRQPGRAHARAGLLRRSLAALGARDPALEPLDAAAGVDQLLPPRVERMAVGADLDVDLALGRTGRELVAAGAAHMRFGVLGMDSLLHEMKSSPSHKWP